MQYSHTTPHLEGVHGFLQPARCRENLSGYREHGGRGRLVFDGEGKEFNWPISIEQVLRRGHRQLVRFCCKQGFLFQMRIRARIRIRNEIWFVRFHFRHSNSFWQTHRRKTTKAPTQAHKGTSTGLLRQCAREIESKGGDYQPPLEQEPDKNKSEQHIARAYFRQISDEPTVVYADSSVSASTSQTLVYTKNIFLRITVSSIKALCTINSVSWARKSCGLGEARRGYCRTGFVCSIASHATSETSTTKRFVLIVDDRKYYF